MIVQHNLQAMNSDRMLGTTQRELSKTTEKLSSGHRVNRAADDAAGLSISEKMRKQIRGLTQASVNVEDGVSAVQVAEGALVEVLDMLQRMGELSIQAANGVNSSSDREYIQMEVDQLSQEIDRVAETTRFNETYLLKGDARNTGSYAFSYGKGAVTSPAQVTMTVDNTTGISADLAFDTDASTSDQNDLARAIANHGVTISVEDGGSGNLQYSVELNGSDAKSNYAVHATADQTKFEIVNRRGQRVAQVTVTPNIGMTTRSGVKSLITAYNLSAAESRKELFSLYDADGNAIPANALGKYFNAAEDNNGDMTAIARCEARKVYDALGKELTLSDINSLTDKRVSVVTDRTMALQVSFHVGADGTSNNKVNVRIQAMNAKGLGINGLRVDSENAAKAVDVISAAVEKIAAQRATLGAAQNRLEHTSKNLENVVENTTASESQIRDADMASEMVRYSNANILCQAGQSMLSQTNQSNQGVLTLLS